MTNVQAANLALFKLGASPINDLSDTTDSNAVLCNTLFQHVLDEVLTQYEWNTAIGREQLSSAAVSIYNGYDYAYSLPSDYLKMIVPLDYEDESYIEMPDEPYLIEGGYYYSDRETVGIKYIKQVTDVSDLDSWVAQAFAAGLAVRLATRLVENPQKKQSVMQEYAMTMLEAMKHDQDVYKHRIRPSTRWESIG